MAVSKLFGAAVKRREDPRLITGGATYTEDIKLVGLSYAAFLRSPHAHARIVKIDTTAAKQVAGVITVVTGRDIVGKVGSIPTAWLVPNADLKTPAHPALAFEVVRYVGDAVAVVVADTKAAAKDAVELIEVDYELLPVIVDQEKAVDAGAPLVHDDVPNNVAFRWKVGGGDVEAAFSSADIVVKQRILNQRLIPNPMETRGSWLSTTREQKS